MVDISCTARHIFKGRIVHVVNVVVWPFGKSGSHNGYHS
jgi:hypothetical protein